MWVHQDQPTVGAWNSAKRWCGVAQQRPSIEYMTSSETCDPVAKEPELLGVAMSWDISNPADPDAGDIPIADVGPYFATGSDIELHAAAPKLRQGCEEVSFYQRWIKAPRVDNAFVVNSGVAFVVNSGELLKRWTIDHFLSTRHFVNNATAGRSGYSTPFFFNAIANYPMVCFSSCHHGENRQKYPTISYLESQAIVQAE
jgi:hypothetical protein